MNYISTSLYRKMLDCAKSEGLSVEQLEAFALSQEQVDAVEVVPAEDFFFLHEQLDALLGPGFAVRVGQQMKIDDYGVLGLSWRTCSQAKEIYVRSERYFKLLSDTYAFKVEANRDTSDILLFRDAHRRGVVLSNEATFSATVVVLRAMTEQDISPVKMAFKHEAPSDLRFHQKAFQCPVYFDQPQNAITYRTEDLEIRTAKADASINKFLVERVEEATAGIALNTNRIITDVEGLIRDALPSGIPSVSRIGQHMGMSTRTLTRRLAENEVSFRDLVRQTQENIARQLLRTSTCTMAEIAFQTGFSEQSAFSRAFKRWTGQSPVDYRKLG